MDKQIKNIFKPQCEIII